MYVNSIALILTTWILLYIYMTFFKEMMINSLPKLSWWMQFKLASEKNVQKVT